MDKAKIISARLDGIRPILFDRYPGDNKTKLPPQDKMYLDDKQRLVFPALNLFSLLCAENTKSVARFGPRNEASARRQISQGIGAYVDIQPADIPLLGENDKQLKWGGKWEGQFSIYEAVARTKQGTPNATIRPRIALPWALEFAIEYVPNSDCTLRNLEESFAIGGKIGLGTFRPFFGRYTLSRFETK